jgi:peptide/nickel transport system permease protein
MIVVRAFARRALVAAATLVVTSVLLFVATEVLPGDSVSAGLGAGATPELVAARRAELGADRPAAERYTDWATGLVTGDPATSYATRRPVDIGRELRNSAVLTGIAGAGVAVLALAGGVWAGRRPGSRADRTVNGLALAGTAMPEFAVAGLVIATLGFGLEWFPPVSFVPLGGSPLDRPDILVLPALCLVVVSGGFATRLTRAAVAQVATLPHVEAARLAGIPERRVVARYLLPSAAGPIAQVLALCCGTLAGAAVVVESIFGYPGLGTALVEAIGARDTPVVQTVGMVLAAVVVGAFLVADLVAIAVDPRRQPARAWRRPSLVTGSGGGASGAGEPALAPVEAP